MQSCNERRTFLRLLLTLGGLAHVPLVKIEILTTDCHSGIALNRCYRQYFVKHLKIKLYGTQFRIRQIAKVQPD